MSDLDRQLPPEVLANALKHRTRALAEGEELETIIIPDFQAMTPGQRLDWYQERGLTAPREEDMPHASTLPADHPGRPLVDTPAAPRRTGKSKRSQEPLLEHEAGPGSQRRALLVLLIQGDIDQEDLEAYLEQRKGIQDVEVIYLRQI